MKFFRCFLEIDLTENGKSFMGVIKVIHFNTDTLMEETFYLTHCYFFGTHVYSLLALFKIIQYLGLDKLGRPSKSKQIKILL